MENQCFTLRVPFRITSHVLNGLENDFAFDHGPLTCTLRQLGKPDRYDLTVSDFESEADARLYLDRVLVALRWFQIQGGVGIEAASKFQKVRREEDPVLTGEALKEQSDLDAGPTDAVLDGDEVAVYPSAFRVRTMMMGRPTVTVSKTVEGVAPILAQGLDIKNAKAVLDHPRLGTALDLYTAFFTETTMNARFITLIMALEALSKPQPKHAVATNLVDRWITDLEAETSGYPSGSPEWDALDSLKREILFRKDESLRSTIRRVVVESLEGAGDGRAADFGKEVSRAYDLRSELIHEGTLEPAILSEVTTKTMEIARAVLTAYIINLGRL